MCARTRPGPHTGWSGPAARAGGGSRSGWPRVDRNGTGRRGGASAATTATAAPLPDTACGPPSAPVAGPRSTSPSRRPRADVRPSEHQGQQCHDQGGDARVGDQGGLAEHAHRAGFAPVAIGASGFCAAAHEDSPSAAPLAALFSAVCALGRFQPGRVGTARRRSATGSTPRGGTSPGFPGRTRTTGLPPLPFGLVAPPAGGRPRTRRAAALPARTPPPEEPGG